MNEEEHMSTRDGEYCIWTRMSLFHHSSDYANITLPLPMDVLLEQLTKSHTDFL